MQIDHIRNIFSYAILAVLFMLATISLLGALSVFQHQISPIIMLISACILYIAFIASLIVIKK